MSKGPGRVSRAIEAALEAEPENAFTVEDLCDRVYRGINRVEKKHRVSVLRAAKAIAARRSEIALLKGEGLGGALVLFNRYRVMSYGMARLKADPLNRYRSNDRRDKWTPPRRYIKAAGWGDPGEGKVWRVTHQSTTEADLRAKISEGGPDHQRLVAPGGTWWRHVQIRIAERDGDAEKLAQLETEQERSLATATYRHVPALRHTVGFHRWAERRMGC